MDGERLRSDSLVTNEHSRIVQGDGLKSMKKKSLDLIWAGDDARVADFKQGAETCRNKNVNSVYCCLQLRSI